MKYDLISAFPDQRLYYKIKTYAAALHGLFIVCA